MCTVQNENENTNDTNTKARVPIPTISFAQSNTIFPKIPGNRLTPLLSEGLALTTFINKSYR